MSVKSEFLDFAGKRVPHETFFPSSSQQQKQTKTKNKKRSQFPYLIIHIRRHVYIRMFSYHVLKYNDVFSLSFLFWPYAI